MEKRFAEDVYDTLRGLRLPGKEVEGVENLFVPGGECETHYARMLDAYERLRIRLGVEDKDPDVETIISSLMGIERELSFRMYEYGARFGMEKQ